jgi:hypothetical protein
MAKSAYIGVGGAARNVKGVYVGVNGVARRVTRAYIGVNGVARQWWPPDGVSNIFISITGTGTGAYGVGYNYVEVAVEFGYSVPVGSIYDAPATFNVVIFNMYDVPMERNVYNGNASFSGRGTETFIWAQGGTHGYSEVTAESSTGVVAYAHNVTINA